MSLSHHEEVGFDANDEDNASIDSYASDDDDERLMNDLDSPESRASPHRQQTDRPSKDHQAFEHQSLQTEHFDKAIRYPIISIPYITIATQSPYH